MLPKVVFKHWFRTCTVKILVVTDSSSGGFGDTEGFHLGQIFKVLDDDPWSHIQFDVTKAHRQQAIGAGVLPGFRFDAHDLSTYSQIWLFGINRASPDPLSQPELKALSQFMDQGGGVFATGDHEDLGRAMCAEVPRVRSMRRWHWPGPGPNGEPVAPAQTGPARHDTVMDVDPLMPGLQGDQEDKVPQPIRPRWYTRTSGSGFLHWVAKYPHPVLCGPGGVINYLPDHMHEGLCEVPSDLSKSYTFSGYTTVEYPTAAGHQQKPEVVAWASTRNTTNAEFGVLAAYDGHRVGVGRVLVDATWHHWFNINLLGFLAATDPTKPGYDPAVVPKWEEIKAYFRNVATWLAHPNMQVCLRNGGWLIAIGYHDILITYRPLDTVPDPLSYYWQLGVFARDALGRIATQCQRTTLVVDILDWWKIPFRLDPWFPVPPKPWPDPPPWLNLTDLENVAMGGAVHALLSRFGDEDPVSVFRQHEKEIEVEARRGAARGLAELMSRFDGASKVAGPMLKSIKAHT